MIFGVVPPAMLRQKAAAFPERIRRWSSASVLKDGAGLKKTSPSSAAPTADEMRNARVESDLKFRMNRKCEKNANTPSSRNGQRNDLKSGTCTSALASHIGRIRKTMQTAALAMRH